MLRIGVMGCANIAQRMVIPAILGLPDQFKLVAVASRTKEKADVFAAQFNVLGIEGYENLLDRSDIDVVYMPLPTGLHEEWITKSLEAGKHILAEKSLALNYESAKRLVEFARVKKLLLMEDFMFKYHAQHQWVWKQLQDEQIGEMRLFRSQFGFPPLDYNNFRYDSNAGGGALLDAGAYTVKASQWFLGDKLEVVAATLYMDATRRVDIYGNASLINEKGIVSQISFGFDNYYQCNYEIWGSKGKITAEKAFTPKPFERPLMRYEKAGATSMAEMDADNHFIRILEAFHNNITTRQYNSQLDEILSQSRILSHIKEKAVIVSL